MKSFLQRNEICHSFTLFTFIFRWKVLCQLSFHPFLMRLVWLTWGTKIGKLAVQFWLTGLWKYHITFPTYSFLSSRQSCFNLRFWRKLVKNLFETISLSLFLLFFKCFFMYFINFRYFFNLSVLVSWKIIVIQTLSKQVARWKTISHKILGKYFRKMRANYFNWLIQKQVIFKTNNYVECLFLKKRFVTRKGKCVLL